VQEPVETQFDRDSTAAEVVAGKDLTGKLAVITGGSVGLGLETARALASAGADVFIGARRSDALAAATATLEQAGSGSVHSHTLDLMAPASVDSFADAVLALDRPVDILVNNAGIMACPQDYTALGIESQLATNYVGHAQLTSRLARAIVTADGGRVVSHSSTGHQVSPVNLGDLNFKITPYHPFKAYGQSKTADVLLAIKVGKHLNDKGVTVHAVHPGIIETELGRFLTAEDRERMAASMKIDTDTTPAFKTVESGSATSVWAATAVELADKPPLYLEDCKVGELIDVPNFTHGVLPYALDGEIADELWSRAEAMLARELPL